MEPTDRPDPEEAPLAEFEDAQTLRFRRVYAATADAVWRAVTEFASLNVWLYVLRPRHPNPSG